MYLCLWVGMGVMTYQNNLRHFLFAFGNTILDYFAVDYLLWNEMKTILKVQECCVHVIRGLNILVLHFWDFQISTQRVLGWGRLQLRINRGPDCHFVQIILNSYAVTVCVFKWSRYLFHFKLNWESQIMQTI